MKSVLRIKTGRYTLSTTIDLPVDISEMEGIMVEARKLGKEVYNKEAYKSHKKRGPQTAEGIENIRRAVKKRWAKKRKTLAIKEQKFGSNVNRWTEEEIERLKELYLKNTSKKCAEIMGRSYESIKDKLKRNNITKRAKATQKNYRSSEEQRKKISKAQKKRWVKIKKGHGRPRKTEKPRNNRKKWTAKEEAYILRNAGKKSWKEIGDYLGVKPKQAWDKWYDATKR